jgi:predicted phosphodiesterase
MRTVAVCSDIHANLDALEAVLADVRERGIEEVWCLGDIVGNGDAPIECVELVRATCSVVLAGNHDLICAGAIPPRDPARLADAAVRRSADALLEHPEHREWLVGLPSELDLGSVLLAHGCPSPFDPVRDYLVDDVAPQAILDARPNAALVLVGHTHAAGVWPSADAPRVVVNVGAVGDPRVTPTWLELSLDGEGHPMGWALQVVQLEQMFG